MKACLLFFVFLNWGIVALQGCISFCCTTRQISHMYTYISPHPTFSIPPSPSMSPIAPKSMEVSSLCYAVGPHQLSISHTNLNVSTPASQFMPQPCVHTSILCLCICLPALRVSSPGPVFQIPHVCINFERITWKIRPVLLSDDVFSAHQFSLNINILPRWHHQLGHEFG